MSRIAYVNGRYLPQRDASVNVEDRGYQFADGIYEVVHLCRGRFIDSDRHLARLERSLAEVRIAMPMGRPSPAPRAGRGRASATGCRMGCCTCR